MQPKLLSVAGLNMGNLHSNIQTFIHVILILNIAYICIWCWARPELSLADHVSTMIWIDRHRPREQPSSVQIFLNGLHSLSTSAPHLRNQTRSVENNSDIRPKAGIQPQISKYPSSSSCGAINKAIIIIIDTTFITCISILVILIINSLISSWVVFGFPRRLQANSAPDWNSSRS